MQLKYEYRAHTAHVVINDHVAIVGFLMSLWRSLRIVRKSTCTQYGVCVWRYFFLSSSLCYFRWCRQIRVAMTKCNACRQQLSVHIFRQTEQFSFSFFFCPRSLWGRTIHVYCILHIYFWSSHMQSISMMLTKCKCMLHAHHFGIFIWMYVIWSCIIQLLTQWSWQNTMKITTTTKKTQTHALQEKTKSYFIWKEEMKKKRQKLKCKWFKRAKLLRPQQSLHDWWWNDQNE